MGKLLALLLLPLLLLMAALPSQAASFDCAKAGSEMEKMICADGIASFLDERMAFEYARLRAPHGTGAAGADALVKAQREWLAGVRNRCRDAKCLVDVYARRVNALAAMGDDSDLANNEDKDIRFVCDERASRIVVDAGNRGTAVMVGSGGIKPRTVAWAGLITHAAAAGGDDTPLRSGSRQRVVHCADFTLTVEGDYLNPHPMREQGGVEFALVTLEWKGRPVVGPLRLAECPVSLSMWANCPEDYAATLVAYLPPGATQPALAVERAWEDKDGRRVSRVEISAAR